MSSTNGSQKKLSISNSLFQRVSIVVASSALILLTASSCSIPGFNRPNPPTLGILKKDPQVLQSGFGSINTVKATDGSLVSGGLGSYSGQKIHQIDNDSLVYLSIGKGIFVTNDGGRVWQRKYILPVPKNNEADEATIKQQVSLNDALVLSDFVVDASDPSIMYVSGKSNKIGKIYRTRDGGESFEEVYSEVEEDIGVVKVVIDSKNSNHIYAMLEEGALIASRDNGATWQKLRSFKDTPVHIGFVKEFGDLFYILFENEGLFNSIDQGVTWNKIDTKKTSSIIGENQNKDGLDIPFVEKERFGRFSSITPITSQNSISWLLVADSQLWISENTSGIYSKIVLPIQNEKVNITDVAIDPVKGVEKIYISIENKLFLTQNKGVSWTTGDLIQLPAPIGFIKQILIDRANPEIMYLVLIDEREGNKGVFD